MVLIVLLPITVYYKSPLFFNQLTILLYLIIILLSSLVIIRTKKSNNIKTNLMKKYLLLVFWLITITLLYYIIMPYINDKSLQNINILLAILIVSLIIVLSYYGAIDYKYFIKFYSIAAYFCLIFLLIQIILFNFFNIPISGKIPFLELTSFGYEWQFDYLLLYAHKYDYVRFNSVFTEPSHLALYCIPLFALRLFDSKRKNYLEAIFITGMIFVSSSGNGIIIISVLWFYYFYSRVKRFSLKKILNILIGVVFFYIAHSILINYTFYFNVINSLFMSETGISKADYRVYRGFDYFWKLPFFYKVFGIGFRNLTNFANYHKISSIYDSLKTYNFEYLNAIAQILIYSGVIGFTFFVLFLKAIYKASNSYARPIILAFILMCLSSSVLFDTFWLLYLLIIFSVMNNSKEQLMIYE